MSKRVRSRDADVAIGVVSRWGAVLPPLAGFSARGGVLESTREQFVCRESDGSDWSDRPDLGCRVVSHSQVTDPFPPSKDSAPGKLRRLYTLQQSRIRTYVLGSVLRWKRRGLLASRAVVKEPLDMHYGQSSSILPKGSELNVI